MPKDDTVGKGGWGVKMSLKVMMSYLDVPLRHYAKLGAFSVIVKSSWTFVWSSILVPVAGPGPGRDRGEIAEPRPRPRLLPRAARAPGRGLDLGPAHTRPRLAPGQQGHQGDVLLSPGVQTQVRSWGLIVWMRSCPLTHTHLTFLIKAVSVNKCFINQIWYNAWCCTLHHATMDHAEMVNYLQWLVIL